VWGRGSIPGDHELAEVTEQHVTQQLGGITVSVLAAAVTGPAEAAEMDSRGSRADASTEGAAADTDSAQGGNLVQCSTKQSPSAVALLAPLFSDAGAVGASLCGLLCGCKPRPRTLCLKPYCRQP
jgi:hypothetical protein